MVITCPSCSARYRLNPDKIKGRGAKITCPKCSHIFVVFSDEDGGLSTPGAKAPEAPAASPPRASVPKPRPSESSRGPDTAGDLLARRNKDTTTGAFKAVGLDDVESMSSSGSIRVVAPGPRKARRKVATIETGNALPVVSKDTASSVSGAMPSIPPAETSDLPIDIPEPSSASDLDFREVGITTWKVKVAIGLIYDFSDISTLKKYLADKKVTEDDLISHNAKDWVRIGDIGSLDRHFVETWKEAKAAKIARGSSARVKKPAPSGAADTGRHSATASATNTFAGQTGSSFASPAAGGLAGSGGTGRPRPRKAKPKQVEAAPSNRVPIAIIAAVLVLGAVGWYFFGRPAPPPPVTAAAPGTPTTTDPAAGLEEEERERIRDRIRDQVEDQRQRLIEEEQERATEEAEGERERQLEPVTPPTRRVAQTRDGALPSPIRRTGQLPPPGGSNPTPAPTGGSAQTTTVQDRGGSMWFTQGKQQFAEGNYGKAKSMLKKATDKCPTCGDYWEVLGQTYQALGEVDNAADAFDKASKLGSPVNAAGP